jgi:hypothetical protein
LSLNQDSNKLEEIVINQTTAMDRSEVRKSKSKVRSYLKRCKDALYGHQHQNEETCTITVHEDPPSSSSCTSWYLTEADTRKSSEMCNTGASRTNHESDEQEALDNEIECKSMIVPQVESRLKEVKKNSLLLLAAHSTYVWLKLCISLSLTLLKLDTNLFGSIECSGLIRENLASISISYYVHV